MRGGQPEGSTLGDEALACVGCENPSYSLDTTGMCAECAQPHEANEAQADDFDLGIGAATEAPPVVADTLPPPSSPLVRTPLAAGRVAYEVRRNAKANVGDAVFGVGAPGALELAEYVALREAVTQARHEAFMRSHKFRNSLYAVAFGHATLEQVGL